MNKEKILSEVGHSSQHPEIFYQPENDKFWMEDIRDVFVPYRKGPVCTRLNEEFGIDKKKAEPLFAKIYQEKVVDLVTRIGGRRKGVHEIGGMNVLVPSEQRRIEPVKGDWQVIRDYMIGMLGEEQFEWYLGWLQTWLSGYYSYQFVAGQVLICIGETSSGKTLLKSIHNHIFDGGGQPLKYMTGVTGFNGELCGVCSLHIDDKLNDLGSNGKKKLKAECKELAVAGELRFEFKNKTAFSASPIQRLLICCNYTEDSVSVIPDIDNSTKNKISILYCKRRSMPMPAGTQKEKDAFWNQIKTEMPAYLYHVMEEHKISEKFADLEEERMGVRGYHNEKALNFVEAYSNDGKRLHAIIEILRKDNARDWTGSAGELVKLLHKEGAEKYANAMSMGRFLNQRMECGTKLIKSLGQRKYWIDLQDCENAEEDSVTLVEETDQADEVPELNDRQVDLLEEDNDDFY